MTLPIYNLPSVPQTLNGIVVDGISGGSTIKVSQSWGHYTSVLLTTAGGVGQTILGAGITTIGFLLLLNAQSGPSNSWNVGVYDFVGAGAPPSGAQIDFLASMSLGQAYRLYAIPSVTGGVKALITGGVGAPSIRAILGWS